MRKLAWFSLDFGAALAICALLVRSAWALIPGAACAAFCALCMLKRQYRPAVALLGLFAGFCWFSFYELWIAAPVRALDGQTVSAAATARDDSQPSGFGRSVYADASLAGRRVRVLLYYSDPIEIRPGDALQFTASLRTPDGGDSDDYYRANGISLIGSVPKGRLSVHDGGASLRTLPLRLRRALKDQIRAVFPADSAPFITALLTGDRSGLSYGEKNALSVSGISHIVAISGMHVAILLGLISLLCGNRRRLTALIGMPVTAVFTLMTGAMPSVIRAAVMHSIWLLAPLLRRENDPPTSLGAAALCILAPNPWAVTNYSFLLSFGSMAGMLFLAGPIYRRIGEVSFIHRALQNRFARPLLRYVIAILSATCGAWVFTTPLIALGYGTVSLAAILTNLLTLWAVSILFELSLALCLLGAVWLAPARMLAQIAALLARHILGAAGFMTAMPLSAVYTENVYILLWLLFSYLALGCCFLPGGKQAVLPAACACVLGLCMSLWLGWLDGGSRNLQMTMLDVGQGQCLVFRDSGVTLMYDCGGDGDEAAGETAARYLLSRDVSELDVLILSHYDRDHAGGVVQLLDRVRVSLLCLPDVEDDAGVRTEIEQCAAAHGVEISYVNQDTKLTFSSVTARLFAPVADSTDNEASLALLLSEGSYDILATGDMPASAERLLVSRRRLPDVEVLIAGHHGSAGSTCDTLLAETKPETVLISVGKHNSYGHPADETLARIAASGAQIYRTDLCGNITIRRG